jgi:hypothetical protein
MSDDRNGGDPRAIRWAKWVGIAAGALTGVIGLFVFFVPGCEPPKPCRGTLDGALSSPSIDDNVSYDSYLGLIGGSEGEATPARLREGGKLVSFRIATEGYKNKALRVTWWLLTASGEPTSNPRHENQLGVVVMPRDCKDSGRQKIWAGPIPRSPRRYLVEIRLLDPNGGELDAIRTPPFPGLR